MIEGIDHLQLAMPAGGEARARAFYGKIPGLQELPKPASLAGRGGLWYGLRDGRELHLGVESQFAGSKKGHPAFAANDETLVALADLIDSLGGQPRWDQALAPRRRFYAQDPFGNRLEFISSA